MPSAVPRPKGCRCSVSAVNRSRWTPTPITPSTQPNTCTPAADLGVETRNHTFNPHPRREKHRNSKSTGNKDFNGGVSCPNCVPPGGVIPTRKIKGHEGIRVKDNAQDNYSEDNKNGEVEARQRKRKKWLVRGLSFRYASYIFLLPPFGFLLLVFCVSVTVFVKFILRKS